MNQTLITSILNNNIYLVNDKHIPFYICIPNSESTNIVINLITDVNKINPSSSNMTDLTSEITDIYSKFNLDGIAVVSPILDSNLLEQVKLNNGEEAFNYLDKYMGYIINMSYKFLKGSNIEVDNKIKLNNNIDYKQFNEWFVNRYSGRVELIDCFKSDKNTEEDSSKPDISNEIANSVLDEVSVEQSIDNKKNNTKEPGFVSYVLLGVVVAVISLVILYLLL